MDGSFYVGNLHPDIIQDFSNTYSDHPGSQESYRYGYRPGTGWVSKPTLSQPGYTYSHGLNNLCNRTEWNLECLKERLVQEDPCYEYGIEHWHPNRRKRTDYGRPQSAPGRGPAWERAHTVFGDGSSMGTTDWNNLKEGTSDTVTEKDFVAGTFCSFCKTLDQHRQHLARRGPQLKPKVKPKPRKVPYPPIEPPPVRIKHEKEPEKEEILYKITVKTGYQKDAATGANVFIRLRGNRAVTEKKALRKKLAVPFSFGRGTSESFHVKGAKIGDLKSVIIEHDGLEKKHGWFLENVQVTNLSAQVTWHCPCNNWLSLFHGSSKVKRELPAQREEFIVRDYEVQVETGDRRYAGTDADVFITLYGKKRSSHKYQLTKKGTNLFERGNTDVFHLKQVDDIGTLTKIRIEHNNKGVGPGWFLEKVIVIDKLDGRTYEYFCGDWISKDEGSGDLFRDLMSLSKVKQIEMKKLGAEGKRDAHSTERLINYEVTVITGNVKYGGTDANVYIRLFGKKEMTREVELDDEKNNFEQGQIDVFPIKAENVGNLKKISLRHDNSGLGAGWFLETVTIKKYFTDEEILERLHKMNDSRADELAQQLQEKFHIHDDPEVEAGRKKSVRYADEKRDHSKDSTDEDDDRHSRSSRKHQGRQKSKNRETESEESENDEGIKKKKSRDSPTGGRNKGRRKSKNKETDSEDSEDDDRSDQRKKKKVPTATLR